MPIDAFKFFHNASACSKHTLTHTLSLSHTHTLTHAHASRVLQPCSRYFFFFLLVFSILSFFLEWVLNLRLLQAIVSLLLLPLLLLAAFATNSAHAVATLPKLTHSLDYHTHNTTTTVRLFFSFVLVVVVSVLQFVLSFLTHAHTLTRSVHERKKIWFWRKIDPSLKNSMRYHQLRNFCFQLKMRKKWTLAEDISWRWLFLIPPQSNLVFVVFSEKWKFSVMWRHTRWYGRVADCDQCRPSSTSSASSTSITLSKFLFSFLKLFFSFTLFDCCRRDILH